MPIQPTGAVSLSAVRTELGAAGAISLGGSLPRKLAGVSAGAIALSASRGTMYVGTNRTALTLFTLAGSPGAAASWRAVIEAGVTIGSTGSGTPALTLGNFPSGTTLTVDNYGSILGAGGAGGVGGGGGAGGRAIFANSSVAYTKTINNKAGALVYAGGGGGGAGGVGGQGGPAAGTVTEGPFYSTSVYEVYWRDLGTEDPYIIDYYWNNVLVYSGNTTDVTPPTVVGNDGATYSPGTLQSVSGLIKHYSITRTTTGPGTPGGAGGAGGAGGRGQGYDGTNTAGAGGAAGAAGSSGSGQGGTGGAGGTGGGWGAAAAGGGTGNTGAAGSGGGGSAGSGGFGGGSAGAYLYAGGQTVTFNNAGGIAGLLG